VDEEMNAVTFPAVTLGLIIALLVIVLAILGMVGVLPMTAIVVFGLIAALGVARCV